MKRWIVMSLWPFLLAACATPTPPAPALHLQLGGPEGIHAITHKTLTRVSADARSARTFKGIKMPYLIDSVSKHLCKVADGPCNYEGETMQRAHADLDIAGSEFEFMVAVLREELDAAGVSQSAKNELLRRLAPTKTDIVKR